MATQPVTATNRSDGGMDFKTIEPTEAQQEQLAKLKVEFEKSFGVDQISRTPEQWQNLVRVYGMDRVKETEKMTEKQIKKKMR